MARWDQLAVVAPGRPRLPVDRVGGTARQARLAPGPRRARRAARGARPAPARSHGSAGPARTCRVDRSSARGRAPARLRAGWRRWPTGSPSVGSPSSPATRRSPRPRPTTATACARPASVRSRTSSRRATGSAWRSPATPTTPRSAPRPPRARASASRPRSATRSSSNATTPRAGDGNDPLFVAPGRPFGEAVAEFATLLEGTGQRRGFRFGPRDVFIDWWTAAHAAGLLAFFDARDRGRTGPLAGRPDPVSPRGPALDRPFGRCPGCPRDPPRRHASAPLAGDPARDPGGMHGDGPGRRRHGTGPSRARPRRPDGRAVRAQALVRREPGSR